MDTVHSMHALAAIVCAGAAAGFGNAAYNMRYPEFGNDAAHCACAAFALVVIAVLVCVF